MAATPFDFQLSVLDIALWPVFFARLKIDNLVPNQITSCSKIFGIVTGDPVAFSPVNMLP